MSPRDFSIGLFYRVDLVLGHLPKHPQACLHPAKESQSRCCSLSKGAVGAFYGWLCRDYAAWFPGLLDRTCLFRLFAAHQDWAEYFLADPTTFGVIDSYDIELVHP